MNENTNKIGKILYLEKRGCDFWKDDKLCILSDVGNYRVGSYDYSIKGKDGRDYILEFGHFDKYTYRKTNKRTNKPLKKEVRELTLENALHIDTQFECEEGTFRNLKLETQIYNRNYTYTLENILNVVNEISVDLYTSIEFIN